VLDIGRGSEARLQLTDLHVSRLHLQLRWLGMPCFWSAEDLGSRNGARLNGALLREPTLLRNQDVLRLGDTVMLFESAEWTPDEAAACASYWHQWLDRQARRLARSRGPVLIGGDTGTGKRTLIQTLLEDPWRHHNVAWVDCSRWTDCLPGALRAHCDGLEERGHTLLWFHHVELLGPQAQADLVRVLDDLHPPNTDTSRPVQVVATHTVPLEDWVVEQRFRRDLYHRLAVQVFHLPPLRQRKADIVLALATFPRGPQGLDPDFLEALLLHDWPGNFRELDATLQHCVAGLHEIPRTDTTLRASVLLPEPMRAFLQGAATPRLQPPSGQAPARARGAAPRVTMPLVIPTGPNRDDLILLLDRYQGNVSALGRHLDTHRNQVVRWLQRHDLPTGRTAWRAWHRTLAAAEGEAPPTEARHRDVPDDAADHMDS
jgi:transcriptional regulator of acetoin/glycerol metabolism